LASGGSSCSNKKKASIMTRSVHANAWSISTRAPAVLGAVLAAGFIAAAVATVCVARTEHAASDTVEAPAPAAQVERGGSLAVYPLLY
jgi:hypothetical protein